uniref:Uncharacterized protein n=1 Tax=Arundo donax TaxID=35708 RepID=A0A0A9BT81_ARUDO
MAYALPSVRLRNLASKNLAPASLLLVHLRAVGLKGSMSHGDGTV